MHWRLFADLAERAEREVTLDPEGIDTVAGALDALFEQHPDLADRVLEEGAVADHVNLLCNGENVFTRGEGLETPVDDGDELALFPPVSGG